jgi:tellurite methyltransferase
VNNSEKYTPPEGYYDQTKFREPSNSLQKAVTLLNANQNVALDFGCGAGSETRFLIKNGFSVTAVDGNNKAEQYVKNLPHADQVVFIHSNFETFQFDKYNLINSARSLSFIDKAKFDDVIKRLKLSLTPQGLFVGELYGVNDQWNKPNETMTFVDRSMVDSILGDLEVMNLEENEFDGQLANGKPKHWHTFTFLAKKL